MLPQCKFGPSIQNFCVLKWKKTVPSNWLLKLDQLLQMFQRCPQSLPVIHVSAAAVNVKVHLATGSRSAKAFSCVRKRSKLPSSICLWMESMPPCGSIKTRESLEPSQALTLSSGSNIWKLVAKSQTVLRSLVRTGLWYIHYREGSIQYWHMNWGSYTANWHISLHK